MKRITYLCLVAMLLTIVGAKSINAQESKSIEGKWHATWNTAVGEMETDYEFIVDGETLTGKVVTDFNGKNETEIKDGKVIGSDISFKDLLAGMGVEITYTGKIEGDEIEFIRKVGDFGTEETIAKRVEE